MSVNGMWNDVLGEVGSLVSNGRFDEALALLDRSRAGAIQLGDQVSAALFTSTRGSLLSSRGRHNEALTEYEQAEQQEPIRIHSKLITANHLLLNLNEPEKALEKIQEAIDGRVIEDGTNHAVLSLTGLAYLAQGRLDDAAAVLLKMTDPAVLRSLPSSAVDFRLAEALISHGVKDGRVRAYVDLVKAKAANEGNDDLSKRARRLSALIDS